MAHEACILGNCLEENSDLAARTCLTIMIFVSGQVPVEEMALPEIMEHIEYEGGY